jgi:bifunctional N-acetylglucosamine-1-phosphate-uridyltransferase/glucosamine-1-phosphate-acetyltransferase GlmU-like protein
MFFIQLKKNKVMKKLFVVLCFVVINSIGNAQMKLGIHIGGTNNQASINTSNDQVSDQVTGFTGFNAGVDLSITMDEKFSFKTGINYRKKGINTNLGTSFNIGSFNVPVGASAELKASYIDIPVQLQYSIINNTKAKVYAFGGPYAAYNSGAHINTKANLLFDINVKRFEIDRNAAGYSKVELGAQLGAGGALKIGSGEVFGEVNYQHGFNKQLQNSYVDLGIKNRSVNFGIGYRFNI